MVLPSLSDVKGKQLFERAKDFYAQDDYIKALEVIEDLSFVKGSDKVLVNVLQGTIFMELAAKTQLTDVKLTYWLGSVESFSTHSGLSALLAPPLFNLAEELGSVLYYKKSLGKAKGVVDDIDDQLKYIIKTAESRIAESKTRVCSPVESCQQKVRESKEIEETREIDSAFFKGLRLYWVGLNVETKRNFMRVSIAEFTSYVEKLYGREGCDALEQVFDSARRNRKWKFWMCQSCSKKFFYQKKFKNHLEQEHAAKYKTSMTYYMAERVDEVWAGMISVGGWEPVDVVAAVEMIKNRLKDVKAFVYENGWSTGWPLAADEERSKLLQEIQLLLVSLSDRKILSCSTRDWMMHFVVKHLGTHEVSKDTLTDSHLVETPQSICFLECRELNQILDLLRNINCERNDGTHLVCRAVDSFCGGTQVKEKIDFDPQFSFLLLDKRLLQCKIARFDDEGTIDVYDPVVHYAKAHAQGDGIISWLAVNSSGNDNSRFPRPIRTHNLDIWVAVLRAIQFTCRTLGAKYAKKFKLVYIDKVLVYAKSLCIHEDERRRITPEDQWNRYASLVYVSCEEHLTTHAGDSLPRTLFLCAVRDILEGALYPTFDFPYSEDSLNVIREHKNPSDDIVLNSIDHLKSVVTSKVALIDSKILMIEDSRINLLNNLTRLSVFDYRSYILQPLKEFLQDEIVDMESKAKAAAAEAELLLEEEKKPQPKKTKKNKSKKEEVDSIVDLESNKAKVAAAEAELLSEEKQEKEKKSWSTIKKKNKSKKEVVDGLVDMESKAKVAAAEAELLSEGKQEKEKKSGSKKKKHKSKKKTSTNISSGRLAKTVEHETYVKLETGVTYPSLKTLEEDAMEPEDTLSSEKGRLEISSNSNSQERATKDMTNIPGEGLQSEHLESALGEAAARYNSALHMTLKALLNVTILKEDLKHNGQNLDDQVPSALRYFFFAFVSDELTKEGLYSFLLSELLASLEVHTMSSAAAEVVVSILELWHCWRSPETESLVTRLFTLGEYERMSCRKCRREPNYPEQSSYGIVMAAGSIRDLKCTFGNIKFEDILKVIRMEEKMLCDIKTGGCGQTNFVHHIISRVPPIFTILLEWEKNETENTILETTKALEWEIDMSRLYQGLKPNTKYRLVSMVGCGEEEEHICLAYNKNRWVSFGHEALAKEVVGNWKSVARFCGERKVRPVILFYEVVQWPNK